MQIQSLEEDVVLSRRVGTYPWLMLVMVCNEMYVCLCVECWERKRRIDRGDRRERSVGTVVEDEA